VVAATPVHDGYVRSFPDMQIPDDIDRYLSHRTVRAQGNRVNVAEAGLSARVMTRRYSDRRKKSWVAGRLPIGIRIRIFRDKIVSFVVASWDRRGGGAHAGVL
jgi:hypothetical protein